AEARRNLRCVAADWLHEFSAMGDDRINGCLYTVDHDVNEQARSRRRRPADHPRAAHFAGRVIKGRMAITALPQPPAKHLRVEVGRAPDFVRGVFDVTDFAICQSRRHSTFPSRWYCSFETREVVRFPGPAARQAAI